MKIYSANFKSFIFKIEEDIPAVGAYLCIYKNHICIYDSLQNDIDACKVYAFEEYGVPLDCWIEE